MRCVFIRCIIVVSLTFNWYSVSFIAIILRVVNIYSPLLHTKYVQEGCEGWIESNVRSSSGSFFQTSIMMGFLGCLLKTSVASSSRFQKLINDCRTNVWKFRNSEEIGFLQHFILSDIQKVQLYYMFLASKAFCVNDQSVKSSSQKSPLMKT